MAHILPIRRQPDAGAAPPPRPALSVRDLVERFLEDKGLAHRAGLLAERTYETFARYLGSFAGACGDLPADAVRPSDVTRWILSHETWKSDHTRQTAARVVQACYRWAVDEETLLDRNPVRKVKPCWSTPRPRGSISEGEYLAIMAGARACDGVARSGRRGRPSRAQFRYAVFFLHETGARPCEMRAATWDDVDWSAGLIRLAQNKTAKKTGRARLLPLTEKLLRLLRRLYLRRKPGQVAVFACSRGGRPWTKDTFGKLFRRYANLAGCRPHVTAYTLRHGWTVAGLEAGEGERQLADALGHSTTRYVGWYGDDVKVRADYLRGIAERVSGARHAPPKG
jgi:integrase